MKLKGNFIINKKDNQIQFSGNLDSQLLQKIKELLVQELAVQIQKPSEPKIEQEPKETQLEQVQVQLQEPKEIQVQLQKPKVVETNQVVLKVDEEQSNSPISGWISNFKYTAGDIVIYKKKNYICLYNHKSLKNWAPEHTLDVLWSENVNVKQLPPTNSNKITKKLDFRYLLVSVGDIITIPDAQFYETNNTKIFQILPKNTGVKVLGVGQGCIRFTHQNGFELNHVIGVFVKGFETGLSSKRALIGSISDDDPMISLPFWLDFNNYSDLRYTFLNGGPDKFGWRLNYSTREYNKEPPGKKAIDFIQNSQQLGMTPVFVYSNMGNSYQMNLININSIEYMISYYTDIEFLLDIINKESPNLPVWIIFEPDFLCNLMYNDNKNTDFAHTSPLKMLKTVKELSPNLIPEFDSNLSGFIKSINWLIKFKSPQVHFGWQINTWGHSKTIPGNKGLMKVSDFIDHDNAKNFVISEAKEIGKFCTSMGVNFLTDFFVVDKNSMSFRGSNAESLKSAEASAFGWNSDHWYNFLLFCMTLKSTLNKNCILWRIPTGHLNCSTSINKKTRAPFKELSNIPGEYEDSSVTFIFGDSFIPKDPQEYSYFVQNKFDSELVETDGHGTIIWKGIASDLKDYGISAVIFGTDSSLDTHSGGLSKKITDDNFFFSKIQETFLFS